MNDQTQQAAQGQQPGAAQTLPAVCIAAQQDGTFLVYPDDQGPEAGQPAKDAASAAQLAIQMLGGGEPDADNQGGAPDQDADDNDAEALFQSGFNQARGTPLGQ